MRSLAAYCLAILVGGVVLGCEDDPVLPDVPPFYDGVVLEWTMHGAPPTSACASVPGTQVSLRLGEEDRWGNHVSAACEAGKVSVTKSSGRSQPIVVSLYRDLASGEHVELETEACRVEGRACGTHVVRYDRETWRPAIYAIVTFDFKGEDPH